MTAPTDPRTLDAIEADLMQTVYDARRLARLRMLGLAPAPKASTRALGLLRRARKR